MKTTTLYRVKYQTSSVKYQMSIRIYYNNHKYLIAFKKKLYEDYIVINYIINYILIFIN